MIKPFGDFHCTLTSTSEETHNVTHLGDNVSFSGIWTTKGDSVRGGRRGGDQFNGSYALTNFQIPQTWRKNTYNIGTPVGVKCEVKDRECFSNIRKAALSQQQEIQGFQESQSFIVYVSEQGESSICHYSSLSGSVSWAFVSYRIKHVMQDQEQTIWKRGSRRVPTKIKISRQGGRCLSPIAAVDARAYVSDSHIFDSHCGKCTWPPS